MAQDLKPLITDHLKRLTCQTQPQSKRVAGVVAIVTDRYQNLYQGAEGERVVGSGEAMVVDAGLAIFSCTKALTATAILQLVESGHLDLDQPAQIYLPELGAIEVLQGFDLNDKPLTCPPKRSITTRMLLQHTAGFGYEFFNPHYLRLTNQNGAPSIITATKQALQYPLLFEPGEKWEYGISMDWGGLIVEAITGEKLGEVMQEKIFTPLAMEQTSFELSRAFLSKLAPLHRRQNNGPLTPSTALPMPLKPKLHMGGHGLYSTVPDYSKFIRMILNDGMGEEGRVLKAETVQMMMQTTAECPSIQPLPGVMKQMSNAVNFFPHIAKTFSLGFMINQQTAPTGRPAGSAGWAGFSNIFYWIDRANNLGGLWGTQILPFMDPVAYQGFLDFETMVYRWHNRYPTTQ